MSPTLRPVTRRPARRRAAGTMAVGLLAAGLVLAACGTATEPTDAGAPATVADATTSTAAPAPDATTTTTTAAPQPAGILATTPILADVVANVLCDRVAVPSVVPRGADAHDYEPTVQEADQLRSARLVVANGLGLEELLTSPLEQARADGVTVTELAPQLDPLTVAEEQGDDHGHDHGKDESGKEESKDGGDEHAHDHGGEDPHVWMDPERMATGARLLGEQLAGLGGLPVTPEEIRGCAEAYAGELTALTAEMRTTMATIPEPERALVTNHEALGYFADRFGFRLVGAIIPSTSSLGDTNPRDLDELAEQMQDQGVTAVFGATTDPPRLAAGLTERLGGDVRVVALSTETLGPVGSETGTYVDMLRHDAQLVAQALTPATPAG